jgi:NDP-sugar pyrophosphorylase family protein
MKAIILAGGKGSRLHPFSATLPKPLMPLGDVPVLELLLRRLHDAGLNEVVLAVNHLRHLIEAFFGDGTRFGIRITYSLEDQPLGTAGPIGLVLDNLGDDFLLANGDLLTTLDIGAMVKSHLARKAGATIGVYEREIQSEFGVIEADSDMRMTRYWEKPMVRQLVSMGVYVLNTAAIREHINPGEYLDVNILVQAMVAAGKSVFCHKPDCFWLDIGRPDDFALAQRMYEENPSMFLGVQRA